MIESERSQAMEFDKEYLCLEHNTCVFSKNIDFDEDFQEVLPQYCDDILRVIKCSSKSIITSTDSNNNEVKIYGKIIINLTYLNENSELSYVDFEEEFSKSFNIDKLGDNAIVWANCCDKYTSFRVINQRRIDIHASFNICIKAYNKITCPSVKKCDKSKLRESVVKLSDVMCTQISKCEFEEQFSIPTDSNPIKRIVGYSGFVTLNETKIIKDKSLVKATVTMYVLYTQDCDDEIISKCEHTFDISKIVDIPGLCDSDVVITNLSLSNVYLKSKSGANDCLNCIDVIGDVNINMTVIREKEINIVSDGYVINKNTKCTYSDFKCYSNATRQCDTVTKTITLSCNDDIIELLDLSLDVGDVVYKNNTLCAKILSNIFYKTDEGALTSCSNSNDVDIVENSLNCVISSVNIQCFDYVLRENNSIDVRITLKYDAYFYDETNKQVLSEIDVDDTEVDYPALTIYFGKKNESVWNIAKSFCSDMDMIIKENSLDSDVLNTNKILIIPGV